VVVFSMQDYFQLQFAVLYSLKFARWYGSAICFGVTKGSSVCAVWVHQLQGGTCRAA